MNMKINDDMKKKLKAVIEYLEYKEAPFQYPLSEFCFLIVECANVLEIDRKKLTILVQNKFFDKLGMAFVNRQKELFKEAGLPYTYCSVKVHKEKKKNGKPKRDNITPYSTFGKAFKARFGFGSKGNMTLYQACYSYYRQTGKLLWESDSWNTIKVKYFDDNNKEKAEN